MDMHCNSSSRPNLSQKSNALLKTLFTDNNADNPAEHFYKHDLRLGEMFERFVLPLASKADSLRTLGSALKQTGDGCRICRNVWLGRRAGPSSSVNRASVFRCETMSSSLVVRPQGFEALRATCHDVGFRCARDAAVKKE
jgi:hypothetical protein